MLRYGGISGTRDGERWRPIDENIEHSSMASSSKESNGAYGLRQVLTFKVNHVLLSIFLLWMLAVHLLGLFFFTKGFLLTRLVLDDKSECGTLPFVDGRDTRASGTYADGCWHPKTFDKAIIILIDALRYDFTVPFRPTEQEKEPSHFHFGLRTMYNTAKYSPQHAFLLPFIADPPTTTLQRLKGLTTGTLPTFIDAGSNFAGTAIEEDNLLWQLRAAGKTIVHLGDDTWHSLFPGYFDSNLSHAYDSFQVWDLHSVDNGVIEHIFPILEAGDDLQWDLMIGHLLGVDHAGHRYGPNDPAMRAKLNQMDGFIHRVKSFIDERTLLVVIGDHGMDVKGDHGGESDDETEAALWMWSKKPAFGRTLAEYRKPPATAKERPVRQIDLVSTLSLLLGLPIPYNNLGRPIEEAFAGIKGDDWQNLASVNTLSCHQIRNYQSRYDDARGTQSSDAQEALWTKFIKSSDLVESVAWKAVYQDATAYQVETLQAFRKLWANFDMQDMIHGIEILAGGLLFLVGFSRCLAGDKVDLVPQFLRNVGLGLVAGCVVGIIAGSVTPYFDLASGALYGGPVGGLLASLIPFSKFGDLLVSPLPITLWGWIPFFFTISQAAGFASNSYTIHEDSILLFFLSTFGIIACVSSLRQATQFDKVLGVYHSILFVLLTRAASVSRLCREEQIPGCRSTFYASSTSSTSAPWQLFIPFAIAIILPEIYKAAYKGTASYEGSAAFWIGFCFRMCLLLIAVFWTIDAADNADWLVGMVPEGILKSVGVMLARTSLVIALAVGAATFIFARPCVNISVGSKTNHNGDLKSSMATQKAQVTILGYANVHGSRYFLLIPSLVLAIALLLPPMGQMSIAICSWQIISLLEILDTNDLTVTAHKSSATGPVILAMLGSYHFFKTGHQAVLSSIQWTAAFVPLHTLQYPWSPLLVIINSFGAQILCAAAVPLTVLWKRPISNGLRGIWGSVVQACLLHILYYATIQLATTLWAGHLRRHLMLYRVFMPRFLMASGILVLIDLILILISIPGVRVGSLSVGEVFGY